jgi:alpha-beta hydrolase superfamily lysophospholipase
MTWMLKSTPAALELTRKDACCSWCCSSWAWAWRAADRMGRDLPPGVVVHLPSALLPQMQRAQST